MRTTSLPCPILSACQNVLKTCTVEFRRACCSRKQWFGAFRPKFEDEVATLKVDLDSETAQAKVYRAVLTEWEEWEEIDCLNSATW